jgi:GR25 family glycosyltransferase involved in LPS biosynthesis
MPSERNMSPVPPIHLINLDRSADRLRLFREWNPHISRFSRVAAVDGAALDRKALVQSGYITEDVTYGPGALGCALSHIGLWEIAISQNRSLTIFEDDVIVSRHFDTRARAMLSTIPPDWDIVLWGYILNPLFAWIDAGVSKVRLHHYGQRKYKGEAQFKEFQIQEFSPTAIRLLHSFGMQGYSISAKGARAARDFCVPLCKRSIKFPGAGVTTPDEGIDCALSGIYPEMKAYICFPQLIIHRGEEGSVRELINREREIVGA